MKGKVLKCDIKKSFFSYTKMKYVGFWVTGDVVKPNNIKIELITNTTPPSFLK